jgi:hypothetical protein
MMAFRLITSIRTGLKLRRHDFTEPYTIACMKWRYISSCNHRWQKVANWEEIVFQDTEHDHLVIKKGNFYKPSQESVLPKYKVPSERTMPSFYTPLTLQVPTRSHMIHALSAKILGPTSWPSFISGAPLSFRCGSILSRIYGTQSLES